MKLYRFENWSALHCVRIRPDLARWYCLGGVTVVASPQLCSSGNSHFGHDTQNSLPLGTQCIQAKLTWNYYVNHAVRNKAIKGIVLIKLVHSYREKFTRCFFLGLVSTHSKGSFGLDDLDKSAIKLRYPDIFTVGIIWQMDLNFFIDIRKPNYCVSWRDIDFCFLWYLIFFH